MPAGTFRFLPVLVTETLPEGLKLNSRFSSALALPVIKKRVNSQ